MCVSSEVIYEDKIRTFMFYDSDILLANRQCHKLESMRADLLVF